MQRYEFIELIKTIQKHYFPNTEKTKKIAFDKAKCVVMHRLGLQIEDIRSIDFESFEKAKEDIGF